MASGRCCNKKQAVGIQPDGGNGMQKQIAVITSAGKVIGAAIESTLGVMFSIFTALAFKEFVSPVGISVAK
jgi:hypothetical protein